MNRRSVVIAGRVRRVLASCYLWTRSAAVNRRKAWTTAIIVGWAATTIVIRLVTPADASKSAALLIEQAALIAAIPSVLLGGPVAAVTLRFGGHRDFRRARVRGSAVGLGVLTAVLAAALAAGAEIGLLMPLVVLAVVAAEVELALRLYRHDGAGQAA